MNRSKSRSLHAPPNVGLTSFFNRMSYNGSTSAGVAGSALHRGITADDPVAGTTMTNNGANTFGGLGNSR
jgi:hypothetical protein